MKRIPIDECPAGPEIDAAVAKARYSEIELVIDLEHGLIATSETRLCESLESGWIGWKSTLNGEVESFCLKLLKYSTDITEAWELVDGAGIQHAPSIYRIARWYCNFMVDGEQIESWATTAPLAIIRAFLKAKGIEFVEVPDETNTG